MCGCLKWHPVDYVWLPAYSLAYLEATDKPLIGHWVLHHILHQVDVSKALLSGALQPSIASMPSVPSIASIFSIASMPSLPIVPSTLSVLSMLIVPNMAFLCWLSSKCCGMPCFGFLQI